MTRFLAFFLVIASLAGCIDGTNPFDPEEEMEATTEGGDAPDGDADPEDPVEPIDSDTTSLPGTVNPSATDAIVRREARSDGSSGDGYAESVSYDSATDTFSVDNLAFDGTTGYTAVRNEDGTRFGLGPFSVFESQATAIDGLTLVTVNQLNHRALYAIGPDGDTSIAIVRTGAYINYGFGGFIYQRDGDVSLPTSGQALYRNSDPSVPNYAGLRDFDSRSGLEYVTGEIEVAIDFDDFNDGAAVRGNVLNRRVYNLAGDEITQDILDAYGSGITAIPTLTFEIGAGVLDTNGELKGTVFGQEPSSETGDYYAILSGTDARTITGVIVVTSLDPREDFGTVRETGGFFAVRR